MSRFATYGANFTELGTTTIVLRPGRGIVVERVVASVNGHAADELTDAERELAQSARIRFGGAVVALMDALARDFHEVLDDDGEPAVVQGHGARLRPLWAVRGDVVLELESETPVPADFMVQVALLGDDFDAGEAAKHSFYLEARAIVGTDVALGPLCTYRAGIATTRDVALGASGPFALCYLATLAPGETAELLHRIGRPFRGSDLLVTSTKPTDGDLNPPGTLGIDDLVVGERSQFVAQGAVPAHVFGLPLAQHMNMAMDTARPYDDLKFILTNYGEETVSCRAFWLGTLGPVGPKGDGDVHSD